MKEMQTPKISKTPPNQAETLKNLVYWNTMKNKRSDKYVTRGARRFENLIAKNCSQKKYKITTPLI